MANVKAVFLVPILDNDGRSLAGEILQARAGLWKQFSAYTFEGQTEGVFRMADGSQAIDVHERYSLILDELRLAELETVLRDFKSKTLLESIYLEIQRGVELRLI